MPYNWSWQHLLAKDNWCVKILHFLCASNSRRTRMSGLVRVMPALRFIWWLGEAKSWQAPVTLCCGSQGFSMRSSHVDSHMLAPVYSVFWHWSPGLLESALASGSCNAFSNWPSEVMKHHFCCFLSVMMSHNSSASSPPFTQARSGRLMRVMPGPTEESAEQEGVATICVK